MPSLPTPPTRCRLPQNTPYARPGGSALLHFTLSAFPPKAFPAVRTRDVPSAHLLHADCGERIRYAKQCPMHGTVESAAIIRGYEYGPGRHVIAQPDELDALRPVQDKALRLERFLAPDQLNPLLLPDAACTWFPTARPPSRDTGCCAWRWPSGNVGPWD